MDTRAMELGNCVVLIQCLSGNTLQTAVKNLHLSAYVIVFNFELIMQSIVIV